MAERINNIVVLGARNYAKNARVKHDFYATDPAALKLLLEKEQFSHNIWECACGQGHLSKVLEAQGYNVRSTDLVDRGYGEPGIDFLQCVEAYDGDIITNPPYKLALEFAKKALELVTMGHKAVMLLRLQFLEGKTRRDFFENSPLKMIYVSSSRLRIAANGEFEKVQSTNPVAYAWYIWEKGYTGEPVIRWFN